MKAFISWISGIAVSIGGPGLFAIAFLDSSFLSLPQINDFLVVLMLPDGTRKSFARTDGVPRVEVKDPKAGHVNAIVKMAHDDATGAMMHDITAYLWTIK